MHSMAKTPRQVGSQTVEMQRSAATMPHALEIFLLLTLTGSGRCLSSTMMDNGSLFMPVCIPTDHSINNAPATLCGFENRFFPVARISGGSSFMDTHPSTTAYPILGPIG